MIALEKRNTRPTIATNDAYVYKLASYLHFKYAIPLVTTSADELRVRKEMGRAEIEWRLTAIEDRLDGIIDQLLTLLELESFPRST